jgi:hypothetical protein
MPIILALGRLRRGDCFQFQDILSHRVKLSQTCESCEEDMKGSAHLGLTGV